MKENYLLALDLGTSSIGYVVFNIDESLQPTGVRDVGVRIFPDGRDEKNIPLAVERRMARGLRRNRDRGQNRVRRLVKELIEFGLLPSEDKQRKLVFDSICPYEARYEAAQNPVDKSTLARAIFHLGRRRGFKSNRLNVGDDESEFKDKIEALNQLLGDKTLGEYLHQKNQENKELVSLGKIKEQSVIRFRSGETEFYASREMYQQEFDRIKEVQGNAYLNDKQWDALKETVFWQYPLKPVEKGKCRYFVDEQRAQIDLPISHQFRIYQEINSLRFTSQSKEFQLEERQRQALIKVLDQQKSLTFKSLVKKKDEHGAPLFPSDAVFNLDVESRSGKLIGNTTLIELRKEKYLGALADQLNSEQLNTLVDYLIEPLIEVEQKKAIADSEQMIMWLTNHYPMLSLEQKQSLCSFKFKRDTAAVSVKFMSLIVPVLQDTGLTYDKAVKCVADEDGVSLHHSDFKLKEYSRLPYYGEVMPESVWGAQPEVDKNKKETERDNDAFLFGKIANPTVHVALNQLRYVVNKVIDAQGKAPSKIHIELTRDLKNSKKAREQMNRQIGLNKKNNDRIRKFLKEELGDDHPSRDDMNKVKLWEELGSQGVRQCVFTGNTIGAKQLFDGSVEVEHIIPFSRCYDDGMSNKTLAFKSVNNQKGNRTPDEAFSGDDYHAILERAYRAFGNTSKYKRFKENAFEEFYGGDRGSMIERQIKDTQYISKKAAQYLSCLCPKIVTVNGRMTAVLRDVWQLNQFKNREEGNYREDHRHHIVDAFVVGLTSTRLIQQLMAIRSHQYQSKESLYHFLKARAPEIDTLKSELNDKLSRVNASYKPNHTDLGTMFKDTAYGIETNKEGEQVCITTKSIPGLKFTEIFQVRGHYYRTLLLDFLTDGKEIDTFALKPQECTKQLKAIVGNDKALEKKLHEFVEKFNIKKLRVNVKDNSVKPVKSAPYKGYSISEYAYCDIWKIPHKQDKQSGRWTFKYEGAYVAFAEVSKYKNTPQRPVDKHGRSHPAAKKLMRLYKKDTIRLTSIEGGHVQIMTVDGFSSSNNKLDIQQNLAAVKEKRNFKSINQIFNDNVVHKMRV